MSMQIIRPGLSQRCNYKIVNPQQDLQRHKSSSATYPSSEKHRHAQACTLACLTDSQINIILLCTCHLFKQGFNWLFQDYAEARGKMDQHEQHKSFTLKARSAARLSSHCIIPSIITSFNKQLSAHQGERVLSRGCVCLMLQSKNRPASTDWSLIMQQQGLRNNNNNIPIKSCNIYHARY